MICVACDIWFLLLLPLLMPFLFVLPCVNRLVEHLGVAYKYQKSTICNFLFTFEWIWYKLTLIKCNTVQYGVLIFRYVSSPRCLVLTMLSGTWRLKSEIIKQKKTLDCFYKGNYKMTWVYLFSHKFVKEFADLVMTLNQLQICC